MERRESDPGAVRLWYASILLVGIYWSISLLSGSFNLQFICWGPLITCTAAAIHLAGVTRVGAIYRALNLAAMFGIGVGIGGGLHVLGAVEFLQDRLPFLQMH